MVIEVTHGGTLESVPLTLLRNCSVAATPSRSRRAPPAAARGEVYRGRLLHDLAEHPVEGAHARETDPHADVGDAPVKCASDRCTILAQTREVTTSGSA